MGSPFCATAAMTTDELQAEIETTKLRLQAAEARSREIDEEILQARERQRLRRELEQLQEKLNDQTEDNQADEAFRRDIDADEDGGDFVDLPPSGKAVPQLRLKSGVFAVGDVSTNFGHQILKGGVHMEASLDVVASIGTSPRSQDLCGRRRVLGRLDPAQVCLQSHRWPCRSYDR